MDDTIFQKSFCWGAVWSGFLKREQLITYQRHANDFWVKIHSWTPEELRFGKFSLWKGTVSRSLYLLIRGRKLPATCFVQCSKTHVQSMAKAWALARGQSDSPDTMARVNPCFWERDKGYPLDSNAREVFYPLVTDAHGINFPQVCCKLMLFEPLWISRAKVASSGRVFPTDPLHQLRKVPHPYGYINSWKIQMNLFSATHSHSDFDRNGKSQLEKLKPAFVSWTLNYRLIWQMSEPH